MRRSQRGTETEEFVVALIGRPSVSYQRTRAKSNQPGFLPSPRHQEHKQKEHQME